MFNRSTVFSKDLRLLGQTKYGVYDQADATDSALLHCYYGAGMPSPDGANDTHPTSNENTEDGQRQHQRDIAEIIADAQSHNIQHEAAEVAGNSLPFDDERDLHAFALALEAAIDSNAYPAGFHLNEEYELFEAYKTGRSTKSLVIPLPYSIWFPRIIVWCQALDLLKRFPLCKAMLS